MNFVNCFKFLLFLLIVFSQSANSIIVKLSDMQTMAKNSDVIVHGYIGDQTISTDDMGRLITLTQIEVIDGLHGAKTGEVITIYQVGGQKNGVVMPIIGGQNYKFGEQVILFGLKLDDTFVSFGAGQGKFDLIKESNSDLIKEDLGNVHSIRKNSFGKTEIIKPDPLTYNELEDFKNEIKLMIKSE